MTPILFSYVGFIPEAGKAFLIEAKKIYDIEDLLKPDDVSFEPSELPEDLPLYVTDFGTLYFNDGGDFYRIGRLKYWRVDDPPKATH